MEVTEMPDLIRRDEVIFELSDRVRCRYERKRR